MAKAPAVEEDRVASEANVMRAVAKATRRQRVQADREVIACGK